MVTIKDVAQHANVSIATVSNVLTGKKRVSQNKTDKVLEAIHVLGYSGNQHILDIPSQQTMTIGFIVSTLDTVYFPLIIRGIQKIVVENGYNLVFYPTDYNPQAEKKYLQTLISNNVDGIILDAVVPLSDHAYWDSLTKLNRYGKKIPVVSIQNNFTSKNIPSVYIDNFHGGYMATEHLVKSGCKSIACITGPEHVPWADGRLQGYQKCLQDYSLNYNSSYVATGDCSPLSGYRIAKYFLLNAVEFDGLFAENDLMALGVIKALLEQGIRVPDDVKVIGYDNIFVTTLPTPSISTIHIPKQRMGEESARLLFNLINNETASTTSMNLPLQLITRQSTDGSIASDWDLNLF